MIAARTCGRALACTALIAWAVGAPAEDTPTRVFWGDTHVHTALSGDAYALGTRLMPEDAYRFAKGEPVRATGGTVFQLREPLDFVLIADHAENLGLVALVDRNSASVPDSATRSRVRELLARAPPLGDVLNAPTAEAFAEGDRLLGAAKAAWQVDYGVDTVLRRAIWDDVVAAADRHNEPGQFTAFVGYEWSGRDTGAMVHRNVLFREGREPTVRVLPFSRFDSDDPEDLWRHLEDYEQRFGARALTIPHNANLSGGAMFKPLTFAGSPMTTDYAARRAHFEPIVEATQIKGDSETHPLISPDDRFADFERWSTRPVVSTDPERPHAWLGQAYVRGALGIGLQLGAEIDVNPFLFGLIGSTDSHTALATAAEADFSGKVGTNEPSRYRAESQWIYSASGYAAVWATENTKASLFEAMLRRETYATTGPRMTVRFYGGWDYTNADARSDDLAAIGYGNGVPMGGELGPRVSSAPRFLVSALKDPNGANLDRIQVVKGWLKADGHYAEHVYDVLLAGRSDEKLESADDAATDEPRTSSGTVGAKALASMWMDPHFDPLLPAFYYVRVLAIQTPRWTAYDRARYDIELPPEAPTTVRDRAYTSPIWYVPGANGS